jgi:peptidoglycan/xylan/chitin deacetylase (PgdA/CDA1 family)
VTFDDAYASVWEVAAPLCRKYGIPAVYFVNGAFLNNRRLAPDNLVCYVANVKGMEAINAAVHTLGLAEFPDLRSLSEVFSSLFPAISLAEREAFLEALRQLSGISERQLAEKSALYLTTEQLRSLASFDFEIGNHTYSHVHCRSLSGKEFGHEIDKNKNELEELSGTHVRSFSLPYGSSKDLTAELASRVKQSGHDAIFLSESVANSGDSDLFHLDRVNPNVQSEDSFFLDLEVLPRLRAVRNHLFRPQADLQLATGTANQNQNGNR